MRDKKTVIFDVDGTIADVEHRRHLVNGDKGFKPDWNAFRSATEDDTPVQWVCDIAKRFIAQGDEVAFFSARNESERDITEKQISEWIGDGHKGVFLRPNDDFTPEMYSNQNLQTSSLTWVVRLTLSLMIGKKLSTCGEIKVSL